ncbi:MAG: hypothetical protein QF366_03975 [Candidatus Poseidoniia archaeon]|nr:hypothetical protein [Candidatus Poseidoniia archaeon]
MALLLAALLIPLGYCLKWKQESLRPVAMLFAAGVLMVVLYPLTFFLSEILGAPGYGLGKLLLFVLLPLAAICWVERLEWREMLHRTGVRRAGLGPWVAHGLNRTMPSLLRTALGV